LKHGFYGVQYDFALQSNGKRLHITCSAGQLFPDFAAHTPVFFIQGLALAQSVPLLQSTGIIVHFLSAGAHFPYVLATHFASPFKQSFPGLQRAFTLQSTGNIVHQVWLAAQRPEASLAIQVLPSFFIHGLRLVHNGYFLQSTGATLLHKV